MGMKLALHKNVHFSRIYNELHTQSTRLLGGQGAWDPCASALKRALLNFEAGLIDHLDRLVLVLGRDRDHRVCWTRLLDPGWRPPLLPGMGFPAGSRPEKGHQQLPLQGCVHYCQKCRRLLVRRCQNFGA